MVSASSVATRVERGSLGWSVSRPVIRQPVPKIYFRESNGPSSSSETPPEKLPDISGTSPSGKGEGSSKGATPPGNGSGAGDIEDPKGQKTPTDHPSQNTWNTIKLLIGTALSGLGSFTAHFTNSFGEGTAKNLAQIGFDFLTTLGFALTGASALSTYGTDKIHINTTSIN